MSETADADFTSSSVGVNLEFDCEGKPVKREVVEEKEWRPGDVVVGTNLSLEQLREALKRDWGKR